MGIFVLWPGAPGWVIPMCLVAGASLSSIVMARLWASRQGRWLVDRILFDGLCPRCGFNLHGLETAGDGCIRCPECGAAWAADRVRHTAPLATGTQFGDPSFVVGRQVTAITRDLETQDANNRRVTLFGADLSQRIKLETNPQMAARLRKVRSEMLRLSRPTRFGGAALAIAGVVVLWCFVSSWVDAFVLSGIMLCAGYAVLSGRMWTSTGLIRFAMLAEELCPVCTTDISGAPSDRRDVVCCPGCAAAWKVLRPPSTAREPLKARASVDRDAPPAADDAV